MKKELMSLIERRKFVLLGLQFLVQTLPYLNFIPIDGNNRWPLHEPLLLAVTLPFFPALWRSPLLSRSYRLFLIWCGLTIVYTPRPTIAIGRYLPMLLMISALCWLGEQINSSDDAHEVLDVFLKACSFLVGLCALAEIVLSNAVMLDQPTGAYTWAGAYADPERISNMVRFCGVFGGPNEVGGLMLVTVAAGLLHWPNCRWQRTLALVMVVSVLEGAASDSRTSFISLIAGFCAWIAWEFGNKGKLVAAFVLLATFALRASSNAYVSRGIEGLNGRTMLWTYEIKKIAEHPLAGYGFAVEGSLLHNKDFPDWELAFSDSHASLQNGYLSLAASAPGFGFFCSCDPGYSPLVGRPTVS